MSGSTPFDQNFLRQSIDRLRDKLIDLSKKNPLISFKHSERGASPIYSPGNNARRVLNQRCA